MKTILTGANVADGSGGSAMKGATVVIDGERIEEVKTGDDVYPAEAGASVYQLDAGYTIIPGLIDCHDHIGHRVSARRPIGCPPFLTRWPSWPRHSGKP
jgi:imidazolonepropionase-like amidohydrolase